MRGNTFAISSALPCAGCGCTEEAACVDPDTRMGCGWVQVKPFPWCSLCALRMGAAMTMENGKLKMEEEEDAEEGWGPTPDGLDFAELEDAELAAVIREGGAAAFW